MASKESGSTWVTNYEAKLWPVVLCDDTTAPEVFMNSRPAGNVFPAILLGKLIYIWVANQRLYDFNLEKDYIQGEPFQTEDITEADSDKDKMEKIRRKAFRVDAVLFETPSYWKGKIDERSAARAREREIASTPKKPLSDDDELEIVEIRRKSSSTSSSKRRRIEKDRPLLEFKYPSTPTSLTKNDRPPQFKYPSTPTSITKKSKTRKKRRGESNDDDSSDELSVREASQSDPFTSTDNDETAREKNRRSVQQNPPKDDICVIFVGARHVPFLVPKSKGGVSDCDFLGDRVCFTEEHRSHIDLDEHVKIDPKNFGPIAEYLEKREFSPRLLDSRGPLRLENVVLAEERDASATKIAKVYLSASKIEHAALQMLCVKKLKTLRALSPNTMLIVLVIVMKAAAYGCDAEGEVKAWLVDYLVNHFWKLVEYEGPTLARLMPEHGEIWRSVLERFAQNPGLGSEED